MQRLGDTRSHRPTDRRDVGQFIPNAKTLLPLGTHVARDPVAEGSHVKDCRNSRRNLVRRLSSCLLGTRPVLHADIGRRNLLIPRTAYCRTDQKKKYGDDHGRRCNDLLNLRDGNLGGNRGGLTVRLPVGRELRGTARSEVLTESDGPPRSLRAIRSQSWRTGCYRARA